MSIITTAHGLPCGIPSWGILVHRLSLFSFAGDLLLIKITKRSSVKSSELENEIP